MQFLSAVAVFVDDEGNVYISGTSDGAGTDDDYATVKYDADGMETWVARYNGPGNGIDEVSAMFVDDQGNAYVTGKSYGSGTDTDYATIKYDTDGVLQWAARYNGTGNNSDGASSITVDGSGNVFVTGFSRSGSEEDTEDYATVMYDADGVEQWVARFNGLGNGADRANALTLDSQGNVLVTGESFRGYTGVLFFTWAEVDYATVKYNTDGIAQWVAHYYNSGNRSEPFALALDSQDNVYVAGNTGGGGPMGSSSIFTTVKYNTAGSEQWVKVYCSLDPYIARSMALDGQENLYVTGLTSLTSGKMSTFTTIKFMQLPTGINHDLLTTPAEYKLIQNYPNPFNPTTTIQFSLPKSEFVELKVYNILGKEVYTILSKKLNQGIHTYNFDGQHLASGIYYCQLVAGQYREVRKMILLK